MSTRHVRLWLAAASIGVVSCAGSHGPDPQLIHVAGSYPTTVALGANTCGTVEVQPQTTTVQHMAGATAFSLTHGPITYAGTLLATGDFTTKPAHPPSDNSVTLTATGKFRVTGFDAAVTVVVSPPQGAQTCQYTVNWVGTKTGDPNVIP